MTLLGYGEVIRWRRVEKYRDFEILFNTRNNDLCTFRFTAGSKAERLTCWSETDHDWLYVSKCVLCVEAGVDLNTISDDIEVYRMDTHVYPGHCRMLLERSNSTRTRSIEFHNALCYDGKGNCLLSSKLFLDEKSKQNKNKQVITLERAGPSLPILSGLVFTIDAVFAVRCQCPGILHRWAKRSRQWPPPVVVQKVVSMGSIVTPVGFKGSESKHLEWRICFNMGETELVNNLNSTRAKLYVILKMIVHEVLKPDNKEMTSYVLKNVIFWQAESNSPATYQEKHLIHWLHDALETLRTAISSTHLPYYIIPERNLLAACGLQDKQQRQWVADITDMMEEGPRVILRLPKIRQAIICHQEPMLWFSRRRMGIEQLMLEATNRITQLSENGEWDFPDIILPEIWRRWGVILREVHFRMFMEGCIVNNFNYLFMEGCTVNDFNYLLQRILM
ncbi:hypothetical protein DPMN_137206 [Dreissena polymorpha]|uniref:Mab-21-like HhH/H2TH-like domain-containing protein n=1 Tax=Dreissena polymorpha TaxID=45954 RepID=A0A9D4G7D2_DREPO|nr:hypothetical protein DPMN_137206 [Dreissena polymorpha]